MADSGIARSARGASQSGKASSDAGPELAGRESCVAMESPQALMCPLEKGVRGFEISGLLPQFGHKINGERLVLVNLIVW